VRVARLSGSPLALTAALNTRAFVHLVDTGSTSLADAEEAQQLARSCGSMEWLEDAATWRVHRLVALGRNDEAAVVAADAYEEVVADGSGWGYFLASLAAGRLIFQGRWNDCRDLLRTALAARCGGIPGALIRLNAAQLAVRCGQLSEAGLHLDRALEMVSEHFRPLRGPLMVVSAEFFLASGEPQRRSSRSTAGSPHRSLPPWPVPTRTSFLCSHELRPKPPRRPEIPAT
jgi:hypothetical protein